MLLGISAFPFFFLLPSFHLWSDTTLWQAATGAATTHVQNPAAAWEFAQTHGRAWTSATTKNDYYWNVWSRGEEFGREISVSIRLSDWFSFRSRAATLPRSRPAVWRSSDERMSRTKQRASGGGSDAPLSYVLSKYWCKCSFTLIATMHRSAGPSQASWGSVFCSRTVERKKKKKKLR